MFRNWLTRAVEGHSVLLFLIGYRWLALLPPLLSLFFAPATDSNRLIFLAAFADNLFLTALHPLVNRLVTRVPFVFATDLLFVTLLLALTGGSGSPYYLLALSPLLASAFFFQMRGALITASVFTFFYLGALVARVAAFDALQTVTQIASFYLIAILLGYSSILFERIQRDRALLAQNNATLERTNRELQSIHNLALLMQSSAIDVADVQEIILTTITNDMGFERAMLATVDRERNVLIGWLTHLKSDKSHAPTGLFHTTEIPLDVDGGVIARAVLNNAAAYVSDGLPPTDNPAINHRLKLKSYAILPLTMRDHPIGVLVVDNRDSGVPITAESIASLEKVAHQAAIALGSTKLCIERAQRLAIEEERNRIAMEIHDTASQSLFGIVYTLDGCIKLLPENAAAVQGKLTDLRDVASRTMNDLRHSVYEIWDGELTEDEFKQELAMHARKLGAPAALALEIQVRGVFNGYAGIVRKNILRIAEEGLANIVKHSGATRATVTLDLTSLPPRLVIADDGCGIEARGNGHAHAGLGLVTIRERARAIGAEVRVESSATAGTRIEVELAGCAPVGG